MQRLLDSFSEFVYVADPHTYELLYLNDACKQLFNVEGDVSGRRCYEVLQGRERPCPFCTNDRLTFDDSITWWHVNPASGHRYLLRDRLIMWDDRPARLEIAFDTTLSEQGDIGLHNALEAESMVVRIARHLYCETDKEAAAEILLDELGRYFDADRAYIFDYSGPFMTNTHEWCAPGIEPQKDALQNVELSVARRWTETFERGECIIIEDLSDIPDTYEDEYAILEPQGISSLVAAPLIRNGDVIGLLGVDNPAVDRIRNVAAPLETLAYFYLTTVQRIDNEAKLYTLGFHDELTGLYNRNRYIIDIEKNREKDGPVGVVFLDVNDMKEVNDRFGHDRGDEVLRNCASIMVEGLPGAEAYRIGGDEFVAVLMGVEEERFGRMVNELERIIEEDCEYGSQCASMGYAWSKDAHEIEALLSDADRRMYGRKRRFHHEKNQGALNWEYGVMTNGESYPESADELAIMREYTMLTKAMEISVSKHLLDEDLTVLWGNESFYEAIGYTREELEDVFGNSCTRYFAGDPEGYSALCETIRTAHKAGETNYDTLMQLPVKDSDPIWIRIVGTFTDEMVDGVPVIYSVFTSVDEVVHMQKEQSIAYGSLPGFVTKYRIAEDGPKLVFANERFVEFFGGIDGPGFRRLFDANLDENRSVYEEHYEDMRAGLPVKFQVQVFNAEGNEANFTIIGNKVGCEDGDPVYLAIYIDTTELVEQRRVIEETSEEMRALAFVDPVTGGRNRASFDLDAQRCVAEAPPCTYTLASIDIHKFKLINDLFGVEGGDRTLACLHDAMLGCLHEGEIAARVTADQFCLLLRSDEPDRLIERMEQIAQRANEESGLVHAGRRYVVTMAVGFYEVEDVSLPMTRIQDRANVARKKTDHAHVGELCTCHFYDNEDRLRLAKEKGIENRMRDALDAGEFKVFLQPKLDLRTSRIAGAEALVRWEDPVEGMMQPAAFIPLFERNGFIVDVDHFVFEQVCALLTDWLKAGVPAVPISVNVSRAHIGDVDFLDRYEEIRRRYDVPASLIEFELTETLVFENPEMLTEIIDAIHAAGYHCSMDDFGSGYSSLNVLKDLAVDTLKLDRAFFAEFTMASSRGADIVDLVIELARRLRMQTVAEGVETEEQATFLKQSGCDQIQGFLFSPPMPIEEFERFAFGQETPVLGNEEKR